MKKGSVKKYRRHFKLILTDEILASLASAQGGC